MVPLKLTATPRTPTDAKIDGRFVPELSHPFLQTGVLVDVAVVVETVVWLVLDTFVEEDVVGAIRVLVRVENVVVVVAARRVVVVVLHAVVGISVVTEVVIATAGLESNWFIRA